MKTTFNANAAAADNRCVLMIAAAFPPSGGPGVQRSAKFAKYLPQFGWNSIVWAADRIESLPEDGTLLDDLPAQVKVHRRPYTGRARSIQRRLRDAMSRGALTSRVAGAIDWRLERWIQRKSWPDEFALWARAGLPELRELVDTQDVAAIYSTHSPISNHWLGLQLRRTTGLPWIADFRDLWVDDYRYVETLPKRRKADARLQHTILNEADVVLGVSEGQTDVLASHFPRRAAKFHTVTNGFDPADFASVPQREPAEPGRFVLTHVGRLDRRCARPEWLAGLGRFMERIGRARDSFHFRIVGHADSRTLDALRTARVPFTATGYVSHVEAIAEMCRADALLLMLPEGLHASTVHCAKLFEYLASQRPILMVGPRDSEAERIVQSCEAGLCATFDVEAVAGALYEMFDRCVGDRALSGCSSESLKPYSRIATAKRLASMLDGLVNAISPVGVHSMMASGVPTL